MTNEHKIKTVKVTVTVELEVAESSLHLLENDFRLMKLKRFFKSHQWQVQDSRMRKGDGNGQTELLGRDWPNYRGRREG